MKTRKLSYPGRVLYCEFMEPYRLSVKTLAKELDINISVLLNIINCERSITPELAAKLSKRFNTTAKFWLNLQENYDKWC